MCPEIPHEDRCYLITIIPLDSHTTTVTYEVLDDLVLLALNATTITIAAPKTLLFKRASY